MKKYFLLIKIVFCTIIFSSHLHASFLSLFGMGGAGDGAPPASSASEGGTFEQVALKKKDDATSSSSTALVPASSSKTTTISIIPGESTPEERQQALMNLAKQNGWSDQTRLLLAQMAGTNDPAKINDLMSLVAAINDESKKALARGMQQGSAEALGAWKDRIEGQILGIYEDIKKCAQAEVLNAKFEALNKSVNALIGGSGALASLDSRLQTLEANTFKAHFYNIGLMLLKPESMEWIASRIFNFDVRDPGNLLKGIAAFGTMTTVSSFLPAHMRFAIYYPTVAVVSWMVLLYAMREFSNVWDMAANSIQPYLPEAVTSRQGVIAFRAGVALMVIYGLYNGFGAYQRHANNEALLADLLNERNIRPRSGSGKEPAKIKPTGWALW